MTGGGGGIGAAIAEELGRGGWFVVTVDPLVTLDGTETLTETRESTADRIVAAGGSARASAVSVTDSEAVRKLFRGLAAEHGGLDAVVNVAGITRQTGFAHGTEADWLAVLTVHLQGYLNILDGALPLMAEAGHGRIVGVTSGSGWRPADAGAYSCAKRVVAALTWQLAGATPPGVTVNAMSPIAATRMVAAAIERARDVAREAARAGGGPGGGTGSGGGLSLFSMAGPEVLGPIGAHLVGEDFGWCRGQVLFAGGSEVAVVAEPRLLEVVRSTDVHSLDRVLSTVVPRAFAGAEARQSSDGGSNPRFASIFDESAGGPGGPSAEAAASPPPGEAGPVSVGSCVIASDRPALSTTLVAALQARGIDCHRAEAVRGFDEAGRALRSVVESAGDVDALVWAPAGHPPDVDAAAATKDAGNWQRVLAAHRGIVEDLHADAGWARAVADHAAEARRPMRLVTLVEAESAGGRSRAQAAIQLARAAAGATEGRVTAFAASLEASGPANDSATAELVAHLLTNPDATTLAGAELVVGDGWLGLRSHPRPSGSVTYGGPGVPDWLDATLQEIVGSGVPDAGARPADQPSEVR